MTNTFHYKGEDHELRTTDLCPRPRGTDRRLREKAEPPVAVETNKAEPATAMSGNMANMAMEPSAATAIKVKGHGTVTAIDKSAGTITLDHGAIPEAKWPAMTMQ